MQRKFLASIIFFMAMFFMLSGCNSSIWNRYPPPPLTTKQGAVIGAASGALVGGIAAGSVVGAGVGAIAGGVLGASIGNIYQSNMTLVDTLQYNGVQVIQLGDEIKLILPTDRFFKPNSPLMNMQYYTIMQMVVEFIKKFPTISIKIAGYTNNQGAYERNLALSRSQAQTIMQYLWNSGIDVRLIYAVGYGSKNPIANNNSYHGLALNNRIEITLRKIRDYDDI